VTFIGQQADPATRTYAVEIELSNSDYRLRSGITTEIAIPVDSVLAQKISPALFALDDEGRIGVRTVNDDNVVEYHHVDILADADDGVWVTGLPNRTGVIVVGQELVTAGERVDPIFQGNQTMPAQTPAGDGASTSSSDAQASPGASDGPGPRSAATSMLQVGVGT
jgi:multidrug efflux system membrane fusion protein